MSLIQSRAYKKLSKWTTYRKALIQIDGVTRWRKVYVDHQRNERYIQYKTRRYYESEFDGDMDEDEE